MNLGRINWWAVWDSNPSRTIDLRIFRLSPDRNEKGPRSFA
jgi:hypothetical protein